MLENQEQITVEVLRKHNRFYEPIGRFPEIDEDEEPYRLLCIEYPKAKQF